MDIETSKDFANTATLRVVCTSATSWEQLAEKIKSGYRLNVGDKVDFKLKSGEPVTAVVTDATDEYVRFESENCVGNKEVPWNGSGNMDKSFEMSDVMNYLMCEIFVQLPDDLQKAISPILRKYKDNEGNIKEFYTTLFLPSVSEIFDEEYCNACHYNDKGIYERLEYYKDPGRRMKKRSARSEDTCCWWLSSIYSNQSNAAIFVACDGESYTGYMNSRFRVPLCFCINIEKTEV